MNNGMPGMPPPVPMSAIFVPGAKVVTFAMAKEWSTWCR